MNCSLKGNTTIKFSCLYKMLLLHTQKKIARILVALQLETFVELSTSKRKGEVML